MSRYTVEPCSDYQRPWKVVDNERGLVISKYRDKETARRTVVLLENPPAAPSPFDGPRVNLR